MHKSPINHRNFRGSWICYDPFVRIHPPPLPGVAMVRLESLKDPVLNRSMSSNCRFLCCLALCGVVVF